MLTELATRSASGFNWSGHRSEASLRRRFEEDGYLGEADGWMVAAVGEGPCLASVGWRGVNWSTPPYSRAWNIGLTVRPEHRRRGIGTRAQQLLCDYLFETTSANRVEAVTNAGNTAEQHALTAAGFTYEGTTSRVPLRPWHDLLMSAGSERRGAPAAAPGSGEDTTVEPRGSTSTTLPTAHLLRPRGDASWRDAAVVWSTPSARTSSSRLRGRHVHPRRTTSAPPVTGVDFSRPILDAARESHGDLPGVRSCWGPPAGSGRRRGGEERRRPRVPGGAGHAGPLAIWAATPRRPHS